MAKWTLNNCASPSMRKFHQIILLFGHYKQTSSRGWERAWCRARNKQRLALYMLWHVPKWWLGRGNKSIKRLWFFKHDKFGQKRAAICLQTSQLLQHFSSCWPEGTEYRYLKDKLHWFIWQQMKRKHVSRSTTWKTVVLSGLRGLVDVRKQGLILWGEISGLSDSLFLRWTCFSDGPCGAYSTTWIAMTAWEHPT